MNRLTRTAHLFKGTPPALNQFNPLKCLGKNDQAEVPRNGCHTCLGSVVRIVRVPHPFRREYNFYPEIIFLLKKPKKIYKFNFMFPGALKDCPLFAGLGPEDLKKLRAIAITKQAKKKQILFSDGEETKGFYVVLSGKVKIFKVSPEGKEQILHIVTAPDTFAEAALFLGGTYPAFAEALSDCQLFFFPKRSFIQLIEKNPQLSINMIVTLSHYLKRFAMLIEELSLKEVSSRIAKYLLDLSVKLMKEGKGAEEVDLDLSKTQLALKLGTISETLSRTLGKMRAKGIIEVRKNRILILDRKALEELASGLKI